MPGLSFSSPIVKIKGGGCFCQCLLNLLHFCSNFARLRREGGGGFCSGASFSSSGAGRGIGCPAKMLDLGKRLGGLEGAGAEVGAEVGAGLGLSMRSSSSGLCRGKSWSKNCLFDKKRLGKTEEGGGGLGESWSRINLDKGKRLEESEEGGAFVFSLDIEKIKMRNLRLLVFIKNLLSGIFSRQIFRHA